MEGIMYHFTFIYLKERQNSDYNREGYRFLSGQSKKALVWRR